MKSSSSQSTKDTLAHDSSLKSLESFKVTSHDGAVPRQSSVAHRQHGPPSAHGAASTKAASGWSPNRVSAAGGRRSYRASNFRRSTSSRTGDAADGMHYIKVIDEDGVNRTPKPLMAIMPSSALGYARGLTGAGDDLGTPASESSEGFLEMLSSAGFSRGWFSESGTATPSSDAYAEELDYRGNRGGTPGPQKSSDDARAALIRDPLMVADTQTTSLSRCGTFKSRTTGTPRATQTYEVPVLTDEELGKQLQVVLTETDTMLLLEIPGVSVAADSQEGAQVDAANKRYTALLQAKEASYQFATAEAQTLPAMRKHKEVQSTVRSSAVAACQACVWDIEDTYLALEMEAAEADDEKQLGSVLPLGAAIPTGPSGSGYNSVSQGSYIRSSNANWGRPSIRSSLPTGAGFQALVDSSRDSLATGVWGAGHASTGSMQIGGAVAGPIPVGAEPEVDFVYSLPGLEEVLAHMEAAIAQNNCLTQQLLYRDIKPPSVGGGDDVSATGTSSPSLTVPPTPSHQSASRHSICATPHEASAFSVLSRRGSVQVGALDGVPSTLERLGSRDSLKSTGSSRTWRTYQRNAPEKLQLLWTWSCNLTDGLTVTSMAWNVCNNDLMAAGYSRPAAAVAEGVVQEVAKGGLVALWSLKNPHYPVWSFETKSGVTAVDFSSRNPNILAVGLHSGAIAIYDVRARQATPCMESTAETGKHSDPVWKVHWLDRGPEREEVLISISTDGQVVQWSITKGLEHTPLIKLKRIPRHAPGSSAARGGAGRSNNPNGLATSSSSAALLASNSSALLTNGVAADAAGEHEAFISRSTGGMSFDFSEKDTRIYLAGTEDGWIHKCSSSYNEQYLESYEGHLGPVYQVQWSPYRPNLFVSCSGDWTIRLWMEGRTTPLLSFQSANDEVNDVQWCPTNSTVFGAVTAGGRLELWDFSVSTLRPVVQHAVTKCKMTALLFANEAPVVVAGNDSGGLMVFRMMNVAAERGEPRELMLSRLEEALRANVMKTQPGQAA